MKILTLVSSKYYKATFSFFKKLNDKEESEFLIIIISASRFVEKLKKEALILGLKATFINYCQDEPSFLCEQSSNSGSSLSSDDLNKILLADRYLGKAFVTGASYSDWYYNKFFKNDDALKNYIHNQVRYFENIIDLFKPDYTYLYCIAGSETMSISLICKQRKIPVCVLLHSRIGTYQKFHQTYDGLGKILIERKINELPPRSISFAKELIENISFKGNNVYDQSKEKKKIKRASSLRKIVFELLRIIYSLRFRKKTDYLRGIAPFDFRDLINLIKRRFLLYKKWNNKIPNNYFYYPLHVNPEASTMVLSHNLTNQLFLIEQIARQIPFDSCLVVKEHVPMIGMRPIGFYKKIESFPKVKLISPFVSSVTLQKKSLGIFSITGTVALEAAILGKPMFVFGPTPFYSFKNKIFKIDDIKKISEVISYAFNNLNLDQNDIVEYLGNVHSQFVEIPMEYLWWDEEEIDDDLMENTSIKLVDNFYKEVVNKPYSESAL